MGNKPSALSQGSAQDVSSLFNNPRYSDLTIKCGDRTWSVHKNIVCTRCEFFDGACKGGFQEATSNEITLDHDEPDAVHALLEYIYSAEYGSQGHEALSLHVEVAIIADKYNMTHLNRLATEKFTQCSANIARDGGTNPSPFTRAIALLYSTDINALQGIRDCAMEVLMKHGDKILPYGRPSALRLLVVDTPSLAADLFSKFQEQAMKQFDPQAQPQPDLGKARTVRGSIP
ncbi:Kelch repeat and BTB domain-containing [Lecanosticta acicola]|uniref:Kelch repeat and BTB domain-containing n=1 Tax=Lecanosticta acicola TaxID=111012 RepID=A0AAI8Z0T2_9PEZI|nr:Kelch repeat and BTB domain-containing [Lecanosticta acicola]